MTDVRLTATTTDGEVVPVLSNTRGELLLEAPIEPVFDGNLDGDLTVSGSAEFSGDVQIGLGGSAGNTGIGLKQNGSTVQARSDSDKQVKTWINIPVSSGLMIGLGMADSATATTQELKTLLFANGSAEFSGDVVIGSRGQKWLIRESNGVAMLVSQETRLKVRDLPNELDLIEAALNEIMEKLKMTPPAGWEVWDGSDNY